MKKQTPFLSTLLGNRITTIAWSVNIVTIALAILAWLQTNSWLMGEMSIYRLFPLFGLLAFSTFWSQYLAVALSIYSGASPKSLTKYYGISSFMALCFIVIHPSLLTYQLWQDGFGLPPGSVLEHFVPPELGWVAMLGMFSWFIFMFYLVTYKLQPLFEKHKWWQWFSYLGEAAMLAVFYHGLQLGDQLQGGWFRVLWMGYGVVFVIMLLYFHKDHLRKLFGRPSR